MEGTDIYNSYESAVLPENLQKTVDIAVFAGQSNMSGRGDAKNALPIDPDAGFEYKSVSMPQTLVPVAEPFGLGEDREGFLYDIRDGKSKRTGSMVSAAVNEYYKRTGRQIVAVSASRGGTNTEKWLSVYIDDAVERLDKARKFLKDNGIAVANIFIVWCQGESDGDAKLSSEMYMQNLKQIYNAFKAHGAEKIFIVQIGHYNYRMHPEESGGLTGRQWDEYYGIIREAQHRICDIEDDFVFAGSFEPYMDYMKDRFHYEQSAYNSVGKTVGASIADYYRK